MQHSLGCPATGGGKNGEKNQFSHINWSHITKLKPSLILQSRDRKAVKRSSIWYMLSAKMYSQTTTTTTMARRNVKEAELKCCTHCVSPRSKRDGLHGMVRYHLEEAGGSMRGKEANIPCFFFILFNQHFCLAENVAQSWSAAFLPLSQRRQTHYGLNASVNLLYIICKSSNKMQIQTCYFKNIWILSGWKLLLCLSEGK